MITKVGNSGSWNTEPPNSEDEWLPEGPIDPHKILIKYIIGRIKDGLSAEDLDRRYMETRLGHNANMPSVFRDDLPQY